MRDELTSIASLALQAANDPDAGASLSGDPDGARIDDTPMSDPDDAGLTDENLGLFKSEPDIPTE